MWKPNLKYYFHQHGASTPRGAGRKIAAKLFAFHCSCADLTIQMDTLRNQRVRFLANYYRKLVDDTLSNTDRIKVLNHLSDVIAKEDHPAVDEVSLNVDPEFIQ